MQSGGPVLADPDDLHGPSVRTHSRETRTSREQLGPDALPDLQYVDLGETAKIAERLRAVITVQCREVQSSALGGFFLAFLPPSPCGRP